MDPERFSVLLGTLASAFGRDNDDVTNEIYWRALEDLEPEAIERAVARAIKWCKFMPRPEELRRLAGERPTASRAIEAWDHVAKACQRVGQYESVDFDDHIINAVIRSMGGWVRLCTREGDDFQVWARKEFERLYLDYSDHEPSADACDYLPGRHATSNAKLKIAAQEPKRIVTRSEQGLLTE